MSEAHEHPHLGGKIPEMRLGMIEMAWTVAIADWSGWVVLGTGQQLTNDEVASWIEIGPTVDATEFQEELYNRAVAAENALTRLKGDSGHDKIKAPWNADTVYALNAFQNREEYHPFTCPREHPTPGEAKLTATLDGWVCSHFPTCDYTQDWAHSFMAGEVTWQR